MAEEPRRRFVVIVNPRGGTRRGLSVLEQVRPVFAQAGAELNVHVTEHAGHARLIADINRTAERLRFLGRHRYAVAALSHVLRAKRRRARLILDGQVVDDDLIFVIACNTKTTGSGMILAPRAEIGDGKLDVVVLRRTSRAELLKVLARVFDGSHLSLPSIAYRQVRSLEVLDDGPEPLDLDGEIKGRAPVRVEVVPAALEVFG